jgi:hypothetical protein
LRFLLRRKRFYDGGIEVSASAIWHDDQPCWNARIDLKAVGRNYPPIVGQNVRLLIENSLSAVKLKGNVNSASNG